MSDGTMLLTVDEAARVARCDPRLIRRAIKSGQLEACFSSRWLVGRQALLTWLALRAQQRTTGQFVLQHRQRTARERMRDDRQASVQRLRAIQERGDGA